MTDTYSFSTSTNIKANPKVVFDALTDPAKVKQYLFGTDMETTWEIESPITYKGEWQGTTYEDKGQVLEFEQDKKIVTTYFSSMSGQDDEAANYQLVTYEVDGDDEETELTISQANIATQESADHSKENWSSVAQEIRKLCEN